FGVRFAEASTTGTSDFIMLPASIVEPTVRLIPSNNGRAKVQFATEPKERLAAGTANWEDWPLGVVRSLTSDGLVSTVTAVRVVSLDGDNAIVSVTGR
ncbi:MAG: hypothetical protein VW258_11465, partial [Thalassolituus sp.]